MTLKTHIQVARGCPLSLIPPLERQRQEDLCSLDYIVSSRTASSIDRLCIKKKKKKLYCFGGGGDGFIVGLVVVVVVVALLLLLF